MKLLFDQNLSYRLIQLVNDGFPGSSHVGRHNLQRSMDVSIWEFAKENGYTIVSKDEDFYELASTIGPPPHFIWIRTGNVPSNQIASLLLQNRDEIEEFLTTKNGILEFFS